mmetsp:Transcript_5159/g.15440  ORF Transcript_5159/g.15440 Transcript_5159/m.15440 type:complete len:141 (+) Transcript_5159:516-938(+)
MARCDIRSDLIQRWTPEQKRSLSAELQECMDSGALRLLDISPRIFVEEMEPAGVVPEQERLLKLRFEGLVTAQTSQGRSREHAVADVLRQSQQLFREPSNADLISRFRRRPQVRLYGPLPGCLVDRGTKLNTTSLDICPC